MNDTISNIKEKLSTSTAVKGTFIVTTGLFIGNILSYILQLLLGRMLTIEEYGIFNALLSLFTIVGFVNQVFSTSLIKLTSEFKAKMRFDLLTGLFWKFVQIAFAIGLVFFVFFVLLKDVLATSLHIDQPALFIILGIFTLLSIMLSVPSSYLQGLLRFKAFSFYISFSNLLRLLIPLAFVYLGWKVFGVFVGLSLGVVISFFVGLFLLKKNFEDYDKIKYSPYLKKFLLFSGPVIVANLGLLLLNNVDVLLVKHLFSATDAGLYAGVLTLGKILLFGAGTVSVVMYPLVSESYTLKQNYKKRINEFLVIQLVITLAGILVFTIFPKLITLLMFGEKFLPSADLLPRFSIFMGIYVVLNFMKMVFLAVNKTKILFLFIPVAVAQYVLIYLFHSSLLQVINMNIIVSSITLIIIIMYYLYNVSVSSNSNL